MQPFAQRTSLTTGCLTGLPGISLQVKFFAELQYCPPLARFIFEVIESAHTFATYNYSKAMTSCDLDRAFSKCIGYCHLVAASNAESDGLLAQ